MQGSLLEPVLSFFALGGPVVVLLVAMSVAAVTVVFYKLWQFRAAGVGHNKSLRLAIEAWDNGTRAKAEEYLQNSKSFLKPMIAFGMSEATTAERLEAEAEQSFAKLEGGFRLLDSIAQLAPLLGLFGTVLGMISAFQALQEAGNQVDPSALAGGIWVALLTTAVGLAVAMPTSLVLNWFESRIDTDRVFAAKAIRTLVAPTHTKAPAKDAGANG